MDATTTRRRGRQRFGSVPGARQDGRAVATPQGCGRGKGPEAAAAAGADDYVPGGGTVSVARGPGRPVATRRRAPAPCTTERDDTIFPANRSAPYFLGKRYETAIANNEVIGLELTEFKEKEGNHPKQKQ